MRAWDQVPTDDQIAVERIRHCHLMRAELEQLQEELGRSQGGNSVEEAARFIAVEQILQGMEMRLRRWKV